MSHSLREECLALIKEDRKPLIEEAWTWLDINCPHYATVHADQQALDRAYELNEPNKEVTMAKAYGYYELLKKYGFIVPGTFYKQNFIKRTIPWKQKT